MSLCMASTVDFAVSSYKYAGQCHCLDNQTIQKPENVNCWRDSGLRIYSMSNIVPRDMELKPVSR